MSGRQGPRGARIAGTVLHVLTITTAEEPARARFVQLVHDLDVASPESVACVQLMHTPSTHEAPADGAYGHWCKSWRGESLHGAGAARR
jgi:hypothetical protein